MGNKKRRDITTGATLNFAYGFTYPTLTSTGIKLFQNQLKGKH
ncbi:hypothetical protein W04_1071 [Pseudoalteromonas sp. SW0106-04]|nr:hypothetical protein W04_1071 [Pseudoalteromonas sp. SW0106-04]